MRKIPWTRPFVAGAACVVVMLTGAVGAWAQQQAAQQQAADQKVAAIKQSLQTSMAALRAYEWIETVTVSLDG